MTQEFAEIPEKFIRLYRKKVRQFKFSGSVSRREATTEKGQREIMRYLLVNGFIPATEKNLALGPTEEIFIDAKHFPENLRAAALKLVNRVPEDEWESDLSEQAIEELGDAKPQETLQGIYINSAGKLFGIKKEKRYEAIVADTLTVTLKKPTQLFNGKTKSPEAE